MVHLKAKTLSRKAKLADAVYRKQLTLVRGVNDTHIFVEKALPLLRKAQKQYAASADPEDRPYAVPSHKKSGVAKRNDEELREIYNRYIESDLYNNLLIAIVSQCESFIFDVLRLVLRAYPQKITMTIQGVEQKKAVDIDLILKASDLDEVRCNLVEQRLHSISYLKPADYLRFLNRVAQVATDDDAIAEYLEIKATRDIIIHNGGVANATYIEKAGRKARVALDAALPMDAEYFDHAIAIIKRIAGIVKRDIEKHFKAWRMAHNDLYTNKVLPRHTGKRNGPVQPIEKLRRELHLAAYA